MARFFAASSMLARSYIFSELTRALYLIVTITIVVAAWLGLVALASPFSGTPSSNTAVSDAGVFATNGRSGNPLPQRYAAEIVALPGAHDVFYLTYLPVICNAPTTVATLNAFGGEGTRRELARMNIGTDLYQRWQADPLGVLVGSALAKSCAWRAGLGVQPQTTDGRTVDLHIIGTFDSVNGFDNQIAVAHYAYVDRLSPAQARNRVQGISAHAADPRDNNALAAQIEMLFAHSDPPVSALVDSSAQNAYARFGKVQLLLSVVMASLFACAALVVISLFAHAAAQRRSIMAVLQVLGFRRWLLFAMFAHEHVLILLAGGLAGIAVGIGGITLLAPRMTALLGEFAAPLWAFAYLPCWLVILLAIGLLVPARIVAKTRPTDYSAV